MKKIITLLLALPLFIMAQAQNPDIAIQVVASGGGYMHNTTINRSLSWTVGQTAYITLTSSAYIITQGFQQPGLLDVLTYTIQGRVKDSQGYLAGVDVILQGETVATDAEGTFVFTELEEGAYSLLIEHDGYHSYNTMVNTDDAVDGLIDLGDITLTALTYTVQGKVKDADGYLAGVEVQLGDNTATTATNGAFTFTNLPAGLYTLSIEHEGYYSHSQTVSTDDAVDEVLLLDDITLTGIVPNVYMVVGKVKDANDYLANITVQLDGSVATTDASGLFTFNNVEEGNYTLTVNANGYELHTQAVSTTQAVDGVVNLGDIMLIAILPDTYTVIGKVKDADGYLANIAVQLDGTVATTDAGGLFTFTNVEEGNYNLTIDVEGYELHTQAVSTTQAVDGVVNLGDITLIAILPDTYTVIGKVKDADGYLANIAVQLDGTVATTDAGGLFTFTNVEEGNYTLIIDVGGYELHTQAVSTTQAVDGVVNLGDIMLIAILPDTYTVKGKVKDADGYLSGVEVQLGTLTITTDVDGLFIFTNVGDGSYTLVIEHEGYEEHSQPVNTEDAIEGVLDLGDILLISTNVSESMFALISIYPNPFGSTLHITNSHLVERVIISNILGQKVMDVMVEGDGSINTEELHTGMYLITLQGFNSETLVRRVVKK